MMFYAWMKRKEITVRKRKKRNGDWGEGKREEINYCYFKKEREQCLRGGRGT